MVTTDEIVERVRAAKNRTEAAEVYADGIREADWIHWPAVNAAILERWTMAGLIYIKERAWKTLGA